MFQATLSTAPTKAIVDEQILNALLTSYQIPLQQKHINSPDALAQLIQIDIEKISHALHELKHRTVPSLLTEFLQTTPECLDSILSKLSAKRLYHIGLESNLPLELALYLFKYPLADFNHKLAQQFEISRSLIFPASHAFQKRVQAYTEIMRIWLHQSDHKPMLELFDIHRPIDLKHLKIQHQKNIKDNIWHYAIYVSEEGAVENLHYYFSELSQRYPQYKMPFAHVIRNQNDRSVLTKIINRAQNLEIEFVTGSFITGPIPKPNNIEITSS